MSKIIKTASFSSLIVHPVFVAMTAGLILYFICLILFFRHKRPLQNFFMALLFMYLAVVAMITISIPLPSLWHISAKSTKYVVSNIEWIPFVSSANMLKNSIRIGNFKEFLRVIGGNFVLLLPLGILVPLINPHFRLGRMIAVAILVPVGIEGLQLLNNILMGATIRNVQVEDVILNAAGCLIGYLIFAGLRNLFKPKRNARHISYKG
jgi:glycopeptide antibiotics resistance protein